MERSPERSILANVLQVTVCSLLFLSSTEALDLSITTENGTLPLEGYLGHFEFYQAFQDLIGMKILKATESILKYSKVKDVSELLPNIDRDEYTFLQILQSLAGDDAVFTNQLLELYKGTFGISIRDGKTQHIMSAYLRSSLDIPPDVMYRIANSLVNSAKIELDDDHKAVVKEIYDIMDKRAVFLIAAKNGNINVMRKLVGSVSMLELNVGMDLVWRQGRSDIVRLLIENNVTLEDKSIIQRTNANEESLLHVAAESKNLKFARELLQFGASIDALDANRTSPLYRAVQRNDIDMARLLIESGANVNVETSSGNIALHAAAINGNVDIVNLLLGSSTDIDKVNKHRATPSTISEKYTFLGIIRNLFMRGLISDHESNSVLNRLYKIGMRIEDGDPSTETPADVGSLTRHSEIVKNIYTRGGKPFIQEEIKSKLLEIVIRNGLDALPQCLINIGARMNPQLNETKETLLAAIQRGNEGLVQLMLNEGMSANVKAANGTTGLHVAAAGGRLGVLDLLLRRGGDIQAVTREGWCLLHSAARSGDVSTVSFLLKKGLDINCNDNQGSTPLFHAVTAGKTAVTKYLLAEGAQLKRKSAQGESVLHLAAIGGNAEIVNILLDRSVDIEAATAEGITPLLAAAERGQAATVAALIDRGADIDARTLSVGMNALHLAALHGSFGVIEVLIDRGLDVNSGNNFRETALHLAVNKWDLALAQLLLDKGAKVDAQDADGRTPLHYAVQEEALQIASALLRKRFNVNVKDSNGKTALDIAVSKCNTSLVKMLLSKGGKATTLIDTKCI